MGPAVTVVLYGEVGSGKSWWLAQHRGAEHDGVPTLGYDVSEETIGQPSQTVRWVDTSGEERWLPSQPWLRSVNLVVFVFSPQNHASWLGVPRWIERTNEWHRGAHERLLLGVNRAGARRVVPRDVVIAVAMLCGLTYVEWDASRPCGVSAAVRALLVGAARRRTVQDRFASAGGGATRTLTPEANCFSCRCARAER